MELRRVREIERKKTEGENETNRMVAHTEVRVGWDGMGWDE
jgi:hypothetical protein